MNATKLMGVCASALLFGATLALAQQPPIRAHGTIESVNGAALVVKPATGPDMTVNITGNAQIYGAVPIKIADVKAGNYVAVTGMPQPDGTQKAVYVVIFPEAMRGVGEGFKPREDGTTMTNATVDTTVANANGHLLTVKYKGGEQKIAIGSDTKIITYVPGDKSELRAGAHISIPRVEKAADGTMQAGRVYVGRDGVVPQ